MSKVGGGYTAIAFFLFLLLWVAPVRVACVLDVERRPALTLGISLHQWTVTYVGTAEKNEKTLGFSLRRQGARPAKARPAREWANAGRKLKTLWQGQKRARGYMAKHLTWEKLEIRMRIGTGDAASTAAAYGAAALFLQLGLVWASRLGGATPRMEIRPDFVRPVFIAHVHGIIGTRAGDIMTALVLGLTQAAWTAARAALRRRRASKNVKGAVAPGGRG